MQKYPPGDPEILRMIESGHFDSKFAEEHLHGVDLNAPICNLCSRLEYSATYLCEAVTENNLAAVAYLLDHGADPNLYNPDLDEGCALWDLQYLDVGQDWKTRYEIGKLFFRYGADPNLEVDGETFYHYVLFKVYNDDPRDENDWQNLLHLYLLLVLYGGGNDGTENEDPQLKNIDRSKIDEYEIRIVQHEDGYHLFGELIDAEGNVLMKL